MTVLSAVTQRWMARVFVALLVCALGGPLAPMIGGGVVVAPVWAQADGDAVSADAEAPESQAPAADVLEPLTPAPLDPLTERQIRTWETALDEVEQALSGEAQSLNALTALRDDLASVREEMIAYVDERAPVYDEQVALLDGITPANGAQVETEQMRALRQSIVDLDAQLQPVELLLGRADNLGSQLTARRTEAFTSRLFERSSSIFNPTLWGNGLSEMPALMERVEIITRRSVDYMRERATPAAFAGLGALILGLAVAALPLRRFVLNRSLRREDKEVTDLRRIVGALWIVVASVVVPALAFLLLIVALDMVGGTPLRARELVNMLATNVTLYFLLSGVIRAFLAPGRPTWRLVPMEDHAAAQVANLLRLAALAYVIGEILRSTARIFTSPLSVIQILEAVPVALVALSVLGAARAVIAGLKPSGDSSADAAPMIHVLWRWTVPLAAIASFAVLVAQLLGYLALAGFLVDRLIWTGTVLAGLHLAAALAEHATDALFQDNGRASAWIKRNTGLSQTGLGQAGVLLSGLSKLVFIIIAVSFIVAPFGVETGRLTDTVGRVFTGITIGGFTFSLSSVLFALALVLVGILITRSVQGWLENRYLPQTSIDVGLKASIRTAVGYVGVIVAVAVGLSSLGLDLQNLALVAGALSVGIGFGLQSIVSNFVSGLILLAERPFKAGDWIVVGDEQGIVKHINVRATELQTFDRATVLIPNSDFISGTVKNRVHRDTLGRVDIPVGVSYDSDPQKVKEVLLEVANAHPMTLTYPEPAAFFVEFGANSLDFMLFAYLADVGNGYGVRSDIRFEIFRRFKEEGIEIPFAQSDVTIRNLDSVLEALAKAGVAPPEALGAGGLGAEEGTKQTGVSTVPVPDPMVSSAAELQAGRRVDPDGNGVPTDDHMPDDGPSGRG